MSPGPRIAVGKVTRVHGVKGEVAVLILSEVPERFDPGSVLYLESGRALILARARRDRGRLLVTFQGIDDRDEARLIHGQYLFVDESALPELPDGSYWPHEIEGCEVLTESGRPLGIVREVMHTEANDVWAAVADGVETLVPALRDVVVSVDVDAKRIIVREIPGLTAPDIDG